MFLEYVLSEILENVGQEKYVGYQVVIVILL